jgi:hypothetical protein
MAVSVELPKFHESEQVTLSSWFEKVGDPVEPGDIVILALPSVARAQTAVVIPANEAAAHIGEYATVEGIVANVFTSKSGNTFLNIGASYPNQTFTGWIPSASSVSKAQPSDYSVEVSLISRKICSSSLIVDDGLFLRSAGLVGRSK